MTHKEAKERLLEYGLGHLSVYEAFFYNGAQWYEAEAALLLPKGQKGVKWPAVFGGEAPSKKEARRQIVEFVAKIVFVYCLSKLGRPKVTKAEKVRAKKLDPSAKRPLKRNRRQ